MYVQIPQDVFRLHCVGKSDTSMLYCLHGIVGMGKGGTSVLCYLNGIGSMDNGDTIG